jgi:hypothetical protein
MIVLAAALAPVHQQYLDEARQMQALSFAARIPLVAFGISVPAMVLSSRGSTCGATRPEPGTPSQSS